MNRLAPILLIAAFVALTVWQSADSRMADLLATWLAGHFYGSGDVTQIYPTAGDVFVMLPPDQWEPMMRADGYTDDIFPFIYPPLWAWAAAPMTETIGYQTLFDIMRIVNPLLICLTLWLAARATQSALPRGMHLAVGLVGIGFTNIGQVALRDGQPQIIVAFLTVLAIERHRNGSPLVGGGAMALAASLKLTPAIYAVVWALSGRWRAFGAFTIFGGLLGGLSIAVAGWPLHAVFLDLTRSIGETVLLTKLNFSFDPVLGQVLAPDQFRFVLATDGSGEGWFVARKGVLWSAASLGCLGIVLAWCAKLYRRSNDPLVWPLVLILVSLLSPLAWVYHYLAAMAFAPALIDRLGHRLGGLWLLICIVPMVVPVLGTIDAHSAGPLAVQATSLLCLTGLAAGFVTAIYRGNVASPATVL